MLTSIARFDTFPHSINTLNAETQRRAVLNEFGDVQAKMLAWAPPANPHAARYTELHAEILSWGESVDAAQPYSLETKRYTLDMSPRYNERDMGPAAQEAAFRAFEKLKIVVNGKVAKFNPFTVFETTIAQIKKHLGETFLDEIAPQQRTGRRTFTVGVKAVLQKAA